MPNETHIYIEMLHSLCSLVKKPKLHSSTAVDVLDSDYTISKVGECFVYTLQPKVIRIQPCI